MAKNLDTSIQSRTKGGLGSYNRNRDSDGFHVPRDSRDSIFDPTVPRRIWEWYYQKRDRVVYWFWQRYDFVRRHSVHFYWAFAGMLVASLMFSLGVNYQQRKTIHQHQLNTTGMTSEEKIEYFRNYSRWKLDQSKLNKK